MTSRETSQTADVRRYYSESDLAYRFFYDYSCHFGYTPRGFKGEFNLAAAQHLMEIQLGQMLHLPRGSVVLDAGCGFAPVARTLTDEFGLRVYGADLIPERLEKAGELNEAAQLGMIPLFAADYHHLPLAKGTLDGVYTVETLVHADPLEEALKSIYESLRSGGVAAFLEYSIPSYYIYLPGVNHAADWVIARTAMASLPRFTHGALPRFLRQAGFESIYVRNITENVRPTWKYLWSVALENEKRKVREHTFRPQNVQGTALVYPASAFIRYNMVRAVKP